MCGRRLKRWSVGSGSILILDQDTRGEFIEFKIMIKIFLSAKLF